MFTAAISCGIGVGFVDSKRNELEKEKGAEEAASQGIKEQKGGQNRTTQREKQKKEEGEGTYSGEERIRVVVERIACSASHGKIGVIHRNGLRGSDDVFMRPGGERTVHAGQIRLGSDCSKHNKH